MIQTHMQIVFSRLKLAEGSGNAEKSTLLCTAGITHVPLHSMFM